MKLVSGNFDQEGTWYACRARYVGDRFDWKFRHFSQTSFGRNKRVEVVHLAPMPLCLWSLLTPFWCPGIQCWNHFARYTQVRIELTCLCSFHFPSSFAYRRKSDHLALRAKLPIFVLSFNRRCNILHVRLSRHRLCLSVSWYNRFAYHYQRTLKIGSKSLPWTRATLNHSPHHSLWRPRGNITGFFSPAQKKAAMKSSEKHEEDGLFIHPGSKSFLHSTVQTVSFL